MSTSDVPGKRESNHDELGHGCWAEHKDGSLILVQSTEGKRVIYDVFDLREGQEVPGRGQLSPSVVEYRDVMAEKDFKTRYSYDRTKDKADGVSEAWTWHDKTPFPWQRVIDAGMRLSQLKVVDPDGTLVAADALGKAVTAAGGGTVADLAIEPYASSGELLTAAQRVAKTLSLQGMPLKKERLSHLTDTKGGKTAKATVMDRVRGAFKALRGG